ncbi:MAG TPA: SRPBCC family protein [Candidatus Acidoferrales bacterium]|nr:SRPBCC family protein [Candidatus Acidoferrales bacterium]
MKWLILIVAGLIAVVGLVALIGALLPQNHVATRAAKFRRSPQELWRAITNISDFPSWRPGVKSVERLPDREGHMMWLERTSHDAIPYEAIESSPPDSGGKARLVGKIADPKLPYGGTWTYEVTPAADGTELRITERGEVYNPIFRFISRFIMGHAMTINHYLAALGKKFGENVTIGD